MLQRLDLYQPPAAWQPGASFVVQVMWFCLGSPLLALRWLPGSLWRVWMLRAFGARIGFGCRIKPGLRVKFPWRLIVGHHCWLAEDAWIDNLSPVYIGDRVCLSQGAYLCTGNHNFKSPDFGLRVSSINIASDCWIAAKSVLAPSTDLGVGCVVSLGSVVSGKYPSFSILRGNPASVVALRSITPDGSGQNS
jgi:putative colanic acid biosynthesis acetyltransferase WcaF